MRPLQKFTLNDGEFMRIPFSRSDIQQPRRSNMISPQVNDDAPRGAFSVRDFCQRAGIGRTAFYEELKYGRLEAKKFGKRTLIPISAAHRWLEELPVLGKE
jgi:excisionase family DNA binding protein